MEIRPSGIIKKFADTATTGFRYLFGTTTDSDNINDNLNENFEKGWENGLSDNDFPTIQNFNAQGYVLSTLLSYLYERGVAQWDTSQPYYVGSVVSYNGKLYESLVGTELSPNISNIPTSSIGTSWDFPTAKTLNGLTSTIAQLNYLNSTTSNVQTQINGKANTNQTMYIGTTANAINRTSGSQTLAGVSIDGNSATATKLATARTINGVSFDGSGNITIADGTKVAKVTSTDNAIVRFNGVTGEVQNSGVTVDDNDNVGIGVTPKVWFSGYKAIDFGYGNLYTNSGGTEVGLSSNMYRGEGASYYSNSGGYTASYSVVNGSHIWTGNSGTTSGVTFSPTTLMTLSSSGNLLVGTTTDNGVNKLQVNGSISAGSIKLDGYFEIGKDYSFGDYTGIQNTRNPISMLVMIGGSDNPGASRSALYLVNLKPNFGSSTTSIIRIAGDAVISATSTYVANDILRVTNTSSANAINWRYLGGYC